MTMFIKPLMAFGLALIEKVYSVMFIEWLFFYAGRRLVESTETKHDDEFFNEIEKLYKGKKQ